MARRSFLTSLGLFATSSAAFGQGFPQPQPPAWQPVIPASVAPAQQEFGRPLVARPLTADPRFQPAPYQFQPNEPRLLPPTYTPPQPVPARPQTPQSPGMPVPSALYPNPAQGPTDWNPTAPVEAVRLPQKEKAVRFDGSSVAARKFQDGWQVWSGGVLLRDFGKSQADAEEAVKTIRELRTTEWVGIGNGRPVVEYGLTNGKPHLPTFAPKGTTPIDLGSVRVDNVRGVWCVRDDATILVNFGRDKEDADQALGVIRKYGFNRLGTIGNPVQMSVLFAQPGLTVAGRPNAGATPAGLGQLTKITQEQSLTRTGIEVPGAGYVGERLVLDLKKVEIRKEKGEYVLAHGPDVMAKFGLSEWSARDALKVLQDMRVTEFCRFNAEVTFFLVNGQPPTRPPFSVQGTRFDPERLSVKAASAGTTGVYEANGRLLYTVESKEEAESLVKMLRHFHFDQQCQMGLSGRNGLKFLAKVGR